MATEEHQPNLYIVLYSAMTNPELMGDLLGHPEFKQQAGQICYQIAGPEGGEDLLQEACLRMSERVSELNPHTIRSEGEFFRWFSRLARHVHLSGVLSAAAINSCTEEAEGWPNSLTEVPPDDMDRFLAHADACPYHTRLLQAKDEKLRAIFRQARGLDRGGRILVGAELQTSIDEQKRRLRNWREASRTTGELVGHVALYNGGNEVATCGRFYDFSNQVSRNELDPRAGLQIRGVFGSNTDEDVLLGFYALAGLRHEGIEKTRELDNGYTVCLKVKQVGETTFEIHFRCVKTEMLEAERAAAEGTAEGIIIEGTGNEPLGSSSGGLVPSPPFPLDEPLPPESAGWWHLSPSWRAAAISALLILVAVPCLLAGKMWGEIEEEDVRDTLLAQENKPQKKTVSRVRTSTSRRENRSLRTAAKPSRRGSGLTASAGRSRQGSAQAEVTRTEASTRRDGGHTRPDSQEDPTALVAWQPIIAKLSTGMLETSSNHRVVPHKPRFRGPSVTNGVDDQRSTPIRWLSYDDRADSANRSRMTRASLQNASLANRRASAASAVLHLTINDILVKKIGKALQHLHLRVQQFTEPHAAMTKFRVVWIAQTESNWRKRSHVVKLNAYIYREGETESVYHRSYECVGGNLDAAYDDAVGKVVGPIMDWIRSDSERSLSASASETGGVEQLGAGAPEEGLAGEYSEGDVSYPIPTEPDPATTGREKDVEAEGRQAEDL